MDHSRFRFTFQIVLSDGNLTTPSSQNIYNGVHHKLFQISMIRNLHGKPRKCNLFHVHTVAVALPLIAWQSTTASAKPSLLAKASWRIRLDIRLCDLVSWCVTYVGASLVLHRCLSTFHSAWRSGSGKTTSFHQICAGRCRSLLLRARLCPWRRQTSLLGSQPSRCLWAVTSAGAPSCQTGSRSTSAPAASKSCPARSRGSHGKGPLSALTPTPTRLLSL